MATDAENDKRISKAATEFKKLKERQKETEIILEKQILKMTQLELKYDSMRTDVTNRYHLIAEVCKGLLNIVNQELGELTKEKK